MVGGVASGFGGSNTAGWIPEVEYFDSDSTIDLARALDTSLLANS